MLTKTALLPNVWKPMKPIRFLILDFRSTVLRLPRVFKLPTSRSGAVQVEATLVNVYLELLIVSMKRTLVSALKVHKAYLSGVHLKNALLVLSVTRTMDNVNLDLQPLRLQLHQPPQPLLCPLMNVFSAHKNA